MSIAVSAIVQPSRLLQALVCLMAIVLQASALLLLADGDTLFHRTSASICAIASAPLGLFPLLRRKSCRIDVTGIGQIRLVDTSPDAAAALTGGSGSSGEVVQLLRDSTLWSLLMVLRLQSGSGCVTVLIILPDSLDRGAFHALSVACRWIAARHAIPEARPAHPFLQSD